LLAEPILAAAQVPNLELGHIEIDGEDAEPSTAGVVVERLGLTWEQWAQRVTRYLTVMERLLWPNLIIVGGGVSEAADEVGIGVLPVSPHIREIQVALCC
jgi:hypothetical protein